MTVAEHPLDRPQRLRIGRVKWFDAVVGYGFITADDGTDIYFHQTSIASSRVPADGDRVKFVAGKAGDGRGIARGVTVIGSVGNRT